MSATSKQIKLIDDLMTEGAPIPADDDGDPDFSMYDSVEQADVYIKQHYHFLARKAGLIKTGKRIRSDEYGDVLNT